jgi:hypothetical protein
MRKFVKAQTAVVEVIDEHTRSSVLIVSSTINEKRSTQLCYRELVFKDRASIYGPAS